MELEKLNNPHHPALYKILALYVVFVTLKSLFVVLYFYISSKTIEIFLIKSSLEVKAFPLLNYF